MKRKHFEIYKNAYEYVDILRMCMDDLGNSLSFSKFIKKEIKNTLFYLEHDKLEELKKINIDCFTDLCDIDLSLILIKKLGCKDDFLEYLEKSLPQSEYSINVFGWNWLRKLYVTETHNDFFNILNKAFKKMDINSIRTISSLISYYVNSKI